MLGNKPYPYLLLRAHETAVVKQDEKAQIEQMLTQELLRSDQELDEISPKATAKSARGRSAFGTRRT
jgi:hypothetical protein